jgi:hypothetical protein
MCLNSTFPRDIPISLYVIDTIFEWRVDPKGYYGGGIRVVRGVWLGGRGRSPRAIRGVGVGD